MSKIFMLAYANIRKTIGNTISLFIMFFISGLLLCAGLLVLFNFGGFFDETVEELNSSDVYYILSSNLYNDEVESYINNHENIIETEEVESIWVNAKTQYNKELREFSFLINDADENRTMSKWKFVGEHLPADDTSIYLPYLFQQDGGYKLNDQFKIAINDTTLTFKIKGFTEDIYFSSVDTGLMGIYLPHEGYEHVSAELSDTYNATIIFANTIKNNKDVEAGIREFTGAKLVSVPLDDFDNSLFSLDLPLLKMSRTLMANMVSVMIVAFAAIIVAVCLLVIRFRINDSIEDDMTKIGSLKAIGYTSRQIILSIVLQFFLIALAGSVVGILTSFLLTPVLSDVFAQQSGLMWVQGFDFVISGITLGVILLIVLLVAFFTSRSINKLNPIVALRGGINTHSFRKNHLPLNTTMGSLPVVLALKSIIHHMKQSIMITTIIIAITFAGSFAVVMFYNTNIDTKTFSETPGVELSNVVAVVNPEIDNTMLIDQIENMDGVKKVQFLDDTMINIDNHEIMIFIMNDYSKKETNSIYQGRYPLHDNEIAISGLIADMIDKGVGDEVILKIGNTKANYIITGLSQGSYMGGFNASIRYDGIQKLNPLFKQEKLQIYLNDEENTNDFIVELQNHSNESLLSITNLDEQIERGMGIYTDIVSKVGVAILILTIAIIILVLYFVINSTIIHRKRELGIQKAIGFTTLQLMNQISFDFLLPIMIGVSIGSVLGITQTNTIMSVAQRPMGIMKADYTITPIWIICFGLAIVIVSYMTSMLLTYRIRKISAYELVSE